MTLTGLIGVSTAQAGTLEVYKLGVDATGSNAITSVPGVNNTATGFTTPGDFGSDPSLTDATTDYRNSWIDNSANWASVTSINVGMYDANGNEVSELTFYGPDTTQGAGVTLSGFFSATDLSGGSYTDIPTTPGYFTNDINGGNYFSEQGDNTYLRQFFVNNNYGGCSNDTGWMTVNVGTFCSWETEQNSAAGRAFLYALDGTRQNWNNNGFSNTPDDIGSADVFAITVTSALLDTSSSTPEPATFLTLGTALAGLGLLRRRRR